MKRILITIGIVLTALIVWRLEMFNPAPPSSVRQPRILTATDSLTPSVIPDTYHTITANGLSWAYGIIRLTRSANVRLLPNFSEKKAAFELADTAHCDQYINGAYYDTSDRPLGLFSSEGNTLRLQQNNSLINGFIWQSSDGNRRIAAGSVPADAEWSLQTGPMLVENGTPLHLTIRNDKQARRAVAFTDADGGLYFAVVFFPQETMNGPFLTDLPTILTSVTRQEGIPIRMAVNLDGGSASVFRSPEVSLQELTHVGSIFCIRE